MDKWPRSDFDVEPLAAEFQRRLKDKYFESIYRDAISNLRLDISEKNFASKLKTIYNFKIESIS